MIAAVSIIMALAAVVAIVSPFFRTVRPQARRVAEEAAVPSGLGRELESDLRSGIISQDEYKELTQESAAETSAGAGAERAPGSEDLESDIERRVRELRQNKGGAPQTLAQKSSLQKPSPRPAVPPQGAAKKSSVCPKCRRPYKQGDRFCTSCGARLTGGAR